MRGQPHAGGVRQPVGGVHHDQPQRADRGQAKSRQQTRRLPPTAAQHRQQQVRQQRQDRVERHLDRQAPHLRQPLVQIGEQIVVGVDLRERQVAKQANPGLAGVRAGRVDRVHDEGREHGDEVGGHDAAHPTPRVVADRRRRRPWRRRRAPTAGTTGNRTTRRRSARRSPGARTSGRGSRATACPWRTPRGCPAPAGPPRRADR